ncbi:MAG: tyrosine--tRNA ligase [Actinomycetia bacterium]|nr:tyrosine--tRNA ligase [Actinomycetes bacterium]
MAGHELTQGAIDVISEKELAAKLAEGRPLRVKLGIDPTASDIHLGFAVVLRKLRQFQDAGHTAVLILGDFTARIGDPSGRSATRPPLSAAEIEEHARTYVEQVRQILDADRLEVRRNSEWLGAMGVEDVLRLTSRSTVARMLERDDFSKRYKSGAPITITEFLYPLMQGWDSVMVHADVELGGTDQLFNLLVGRQLQEQEGQAPQVVLTTPLLPGLGGGAKMSKSLGNYVGIAEPPAEQFGKLMSIPDDLLPLYFQYTTGWPQSEIDKVNAQVANGTLHPNAAKRLLARTVVDLYHGPGAGDAAEAQFDRVFKAHEAPPRDEMAQVTLAESDAGDDGTIRVSRLLAKSGLVTSNREGARAITEGGVQIDGEKVLDDRAIALHDIPPAGMVLQQGKRKWAVVRGPDSGGRTGAE